MAKVSFDFMYNKFSRFINFVIYHNAMVRVLLEFLFNYLFFSAYILIIEKHHLFILFEKNKYVKPFHILLSYLKKK